MLFASNDQRPRIRPTSQVRCCAAIHVTRQYPRAQRRERAMLGQTRYLARPLSLLVGYIIALCTITPALAGTWTPLGVLHTPRDNASVALLPNGLVLVAGGANAGGTLNSAELYDPATGTFSVTGSLTTVRYDATATMLTNGTVLIAGGANGSAAALATAEIYNPANGTFSTTGSMAVARSTSCVSTSGTGKSTPLSAMRASTASSAWSNARQDSCRSASCAPVPQSTPP